MAVKILWSPAVCPEERKRYQWEHIIRFEMGEESADLVVSLRLEQAQWRWKVETPVPASRERIVRALRATGKPVV